MGNLPCHHCHVPTHEHWNCWDMKVTECGRCTDITKAELMLEVLKLNTRIPPDKVYLSESNRHKEGRPHKLDSKQEAAIIDAYENNPKDNSYSKLAKQYGVDKKTIGNIINRKKMSKKS